MIQHSFPGLVHFSYSLVNMECLHAGRQRVVYLITYSRADVVKFPSKESFSRAVLQAWQNFGVRVVQWVTCIEAHHITDNGLHGENMNLPYLFGYKPISAISRDPKLVTQKINLINTNCKCIILGYKPRAIFGLEVYRRQRDSDRKIILKAIK